MKKQLLTGLFLLLMLHVNAQFLLAEDFDFSGEVNGSNGWIRTSGTSNFMQTITPSLIFANYPGSGIGNAVSVRGVAGDDVYRRITARTKLYYSFLIKVVAANTQQKDGYLSFLGKEQVSGVNGTLNGNYFARIAIRTLGDGTWQIGTSNWALTNTANLPIYSSGVFNNNQTYAVIVSFDMAQNYKVAIWVKENNFPLNEADAGTPDVVFVAAPNTAALPTAVDVIGLRQDTKSPNVIMDALRVFDTWSASVLPLKLLSFSGILNQDKNVKLEWIAAQSVNVKHFEIEKSADAKAFQYAGAVNCINQTSEHDYSFTDYTINNATAYYRLKIVDFDGKFEYSAVITIRNAETQTIKIGSLGGKTIKVYLPTVTNIKTIHILDMNGIVKKSINTNTGQGFVQINLSEFPVGMYVLQLVGVSSTTSQKFFLQ